MKEFDAKFWAEKARELGVLMYAPSFATDAALANWYKYLIESEEFVNLFSQSRKPLSNFLATFQPPTVLAYCIDDLGDIWATMWFTPFDGFYGSAASASAWVREDRRGSAEARQARNFCYEMAFKVWRTIISVTRQEGLLRYLRKLGYNILGRIPNLVEGEDAWIVYLTEENFKGD